GGPGRDQDQRPLAAGYRFLHRLLALPLALAAGGLGGVLGSLPDRHHVRCQPVRPALSRARAVPADVLPGHVPPPRFGPQPRSLPGWSYPDWAVLPTSPVRRRSPPSGGAARSAEPVAARSAR